MKYIKRYIPSLDLLFLNQFSNIVVDKSSKEPREIGSICLRKWAVMMNFMSIVLKKESGISS